MYRENDKTLFFIITSTFNRSDLVLRTVNSVLQQNYRHFKLAIFNDGSHQDYTDLENLINKNPDIIYMKSKINVGSNKSKNIMIDYCIKNFGIENIYFFVLDDDDYLTSNALSIINDEININNKDNWLCFNCNSLSTSTFKNETYHEYGKITYKDFKKNYPGDKHFVFKLESIGSIRFPEKYFKNGYEHIFLDQLKSKITIIPETVKIIEYQENGLSLSPLYHSFGSIPTAVKHVLSAPRVPSYYWLLIKSLKMKSIIKMTIGENRYYKIKNLFKLRK